MARLEPEQVFTPYRPVTGEMFVRRSEMALGSQSDTQGALRYALRQSGCQVLLYGDTGVGKTSLLRQVSDEEGLGRVELQVKTGMSHAQILDGLVRQVVDVKKVDYRSFGLVETSVSVDGGVPFFATLRGKIKGAGGSETNYAVVEKDAIDVLAEVLPRARRTLIVLENFHNLGKDATAKGKATAALVAQTLEELSDRASSAVGSDVKAVVIGIAEGFGELLAESSSLIRRTVQVGVPLMPDGEIAGILTKGFKKLGLNVDAKILEKFVFDSDGFPYFAHLLGLNASLAARESRSKGITEAHLAAALIQVANMAGATYSHRRRLASEVAGRMARTNIMRMLAFSDRRQWSSSDVQEMWTTQIGPIDISTISGALAELCGSPHGTILRRTADGRRYLYQFEDPRIRPYLRVVDRLSGVTTGES